MKRISKAILLLTIAAILMAGLASCSLTDTLQRLFVGAMDDGTENFDMGVIESGVYTSDFAGMQFTLPQGWVFYDREELLALSGLDENDDADALKKEILEKTTVYDMYAMNPSTGSNIIIMFENIRVQGLDPETFDVQDYSEALTKNLSGQTEIAYEKTKERTVALGGYEFLSIEFNANAAAYSYSICQKYFIRQIGDFMMSIIVTGNVSPESYFSALDAA